MSKRNRAPNSDRSFLRADRPKENYGKPIRVKHLRKKMNKPGYETFFAKCKREDPERFAEMRRKAEATGRLSMGSVHGSMIGFPVRVVRETRKAAQIRAKELFKKMEQKDLIDADDKIANKAILKLLEVISMNDSVPADHPNKRIVSVSDEIKAASKLLEFTKAKPMTKSEVTVKNAEDFLAELMADEDQKGTE